jgi:hypothetical protein
MPVLDNGMHVQRTENTTLPARIGSEADQSPAKGGA